MDVLHRLDATDRRLHDGVERLHAQADARDAGRAEHGGPVRVEPARIDLDRHDWIAAAKRAADTLHPSGEHGRRQRVRAAPAERDPADPRAADPVRDQCDLGFEPRDIGFEPRGPVRRAGVAPAIPADLAAIGDVEVERDGLVGGNPRQRIAHVTRADVLAELGGGGIARVARDRAGEQLWMIGPHAAFVRRAPRAGL